MLRKPNKYHLSITNWKEILSILRFCFFIFNMSITTILIILVFAKWLLWESNWTMTKCIFQLCNLIAFPFDQYLFSAYLGPGPVKIKKRKSIIPKMKAPNTRGNRETHQKYNIVWLCVVTEIYRKCTRS